MPETMAEGVDGNETIHRFYSQTDAAQSYSKNNGIQLKQGIIKLYLRF